MRDVILAQLAAAREALAAGPEASEKARAAALASLDAAAALVDAWGNLDEPAGPEAPPPDGTGVCRHEPAKRIKTPSHGDPGAWLCPCGFNGTDSAPAGA